ncbi:MAG: 50S ribosomal protein L3 [Candidatus Doudnabacteria bacterium RIFCSPHIGHO2_01_FULL_50_11]|uniref:50S ribosomal protein L3 n=1 Tax=Candidatus Doudnabacteria bacterium RIFCSPHIGHO2_01_FULL_50_11 TaxID=1817828 RepID=A0A1F5PMY7_9BACT|nr:ribosomal protein L3 [uncultured bacterium]OGE91261.1 MAG: 50S ribosomal protein L3 [Candidatus Doudnabacteria bacterium RIFCSPHIGHO2_01_FULL_50_11]
MKFILGRKLNMSAVWTKDGARIPVTVLEAGPCKVVQVKTRDRDGYSGVQIGFGRKKQLSDALRGHMKNDTFQYLREFQIPESEQIAAGQMITVKEFEPGEYVNVSGIMKGRGFAGAVKRHGFHGAPASHGHDHPRAVGSIGSRFPQHTLKGTRMAGRMGGNQSTLKNTFVVDTDPERNLLYVMGPVPGTRGGLVKIMTTGEKKEAPEIFEASPNPQATPIEPVTSEQTANPKEEVKTEEKTA